MWVEIHRSWKEESNQFLLGIYYRRIKSPIGKPLATQVPARWG